MLNVSENVTFQDAIAFSQTLVGKMANQQLKETEIEAAIASLVKTENGARGFFVTYLTDKTSLADHPSLAVIQALYSAPEIVSELLVKNLAMSAAMTVTHRRNNDQTMAESSALVCQRTTNLINLVKLTEIQDKLKELQDTIITGNGNYQDFLDRWGYDLEQKQIIQEKIGVIINN